MLKLCVYTWIAFAYVMKIQALYCSYGHDHGGSHYNISSWNVTECPNNGVPQRCYRYEGVGPFEILFANYYVTANCVNYTICDDPCGSVIKHFKVSDDVDLSSSSCKSVCCDKDFCNNGSVSEIEKFLKDNEAENGMKNETNKDFQTKFSTPLVTNVMSEDPSSTPSKMPGLRCGIGTFVDPLLSDDTNGNIEELYCGNSEEAQCLREEASVTSNGLELNVVVAICANSSVCDHPCGGMAKRKLEQVLSSENQLSVKMNSCNMKCCNSNYCNKLPLKQHHSFRQLNKQASTDKTPGQSAGTLTASRVAVLTFVIASVVTFL